MNDLIFPRYLHKTYVFIYYAKIIINLRPDFGLLGLKRQLDNNKCFITILTDLEFEYFSLFLCGNLGMKSIKMKK